MKDIIDLLEALPQYITLFYPGYITIYLYFFFTGKRFEDDKWNIAKAVFISFCYNSLASEVLRLVKSENDFFYNFILTCTALLVGLVAAKVRAMKIFNTFLNWIQEDVVYIDNEFEGLRNENRSAWVCVYMKEEDIVYEGSLRDVVLDTKTNKYISLSGYYKYKIDDKGKPITPYIEDLTSDNEEKVIIYYDNIVRVEKRNTQ